MTDTPDITTARRLKALDCALYYFKEIVGRPLIASDEKRSQYPPPAVDEVISAAMKFDRFLVVGSHA